jgi:hypothetical protein
MKLSLVVLITCVLGVSALAVSEQSANLTVGFIKLETELYLAIQKKDVSRLDQLLAPDYVLVTSARAGYPMDRKSWLDLVAVYNVESFTIGDVVVRCLVPRGDTGDKCDMAAVSLTGAQKAIVGGEDRSGEGLLVDIWLRHNGSWQLFSRYAGTKSNSLPKVMQPRPSQK